jgi:hypothetical protein
MSAPTEIDMPEGLVCLSDVVPRPIEWLWPLRLAAGKPALLEGDFELGKSLITLDLCARLTTGRPFPDGQPGPERCNVLLLTVEDSVHDVIVPRLDAMGADRKRTFHLNLFAACVRNSFPSRLDAFERVLIRSQARFSVIDPIKAFLDPNINVNSDHSLRRALDPLFELAAKHRSTTLLINHLNKNEGARALYRGSGSLAFPIACRSSWLVAADPHDPGRRILAPGKNNYAARQPGLAYKITGTKDAPAITWLGECDALPEHLLARNRARGRPDHARARAKAWLEDFLQSGSCPAVTVEAAGRAQGLSRPTVHRARKELGVEKFRIRDGEQVVTYWALRGQALPEHIPTSAIIWEPAEVLKPIPDSEPESPP